MWTWLQRLLTKTSQTDTCPWEIEPYLTDATDNLVTSLQKEGDPMDSPRLLECTLVLPSLDDITKLRNQLPPPWKTKARKWPEEECWICECTKLVQPTRNEIKEQVKMLWLLSLSHHPVLWSYLGLYSDDRTLRVEITCSILDYR